MKTVIDDWLFDPVAKRFTFFRPIVPHRLMMITHQPTTTIVYNLADPSEGGTFPDATSLVVEHDVTAFNEDDEFTIIYEDYPEPREDRPAGVDLLIDGDYPLTTAEGVQVVSLAGSFGLPIDTTQDGLNVFQVNTADIVRPPTSVPGSKADSAGAVVGGAWTLPYSVAQGQTLIIDAANFRGLSLSVPTTQGVLSWFQSNHPDRNFTAFSMQHSTGAVSTSNGGGGTTTGFWIGNLSCRYLALTCINAQSAGVLQFTAWPNGYQPPSQFAQSAVVNNADSNGASAGGLITISQPWVQRGWTPATVATEVTGTFMDRQRAVIDKMESTGIGVLAAGIMGQYDDVAPSLGTENRFYVGRVTKNRAQHSVLRDGSAGANEIGAPVLSRDALQVADINAGLLPSGTPLLESIPGVQAISIVDELGDTIDTLNHALAVYDVTQERARSPFSDLGQNAAGLLQSNTLLSVVATNINAAMRYLQFFVGTPSLGIKPILSFPLPAGSATAPGSVALGVDVLGPNGTAFSGLIGWGFSTTVGTYTAATAADHTINGLTR